MYPYLGTYVNTLFFGIAMFAVEEETILFADSSWISSGGRPPRQVKRDSWVDDVYGWRGV
jgi:hypothetical protein